MNELAPTRQMVLDVIDGRMTMEEYEQEYYKLLDERFLDPFHIIEQIPHNAILLCYEKPTDPCHRHMLRKYVYDKTGFEIEEWKNPKEQKEADKQGIVDSLLDL